MIRGSQRFLEPEQQDIVAEYLSGVSVAQIARSHHCADWTVYRILNRNGIQRKQRSPAIREPRPGANVPAKPRPTANLPVAQGLFSDRAAALARLMAGR